MALSLRCSITTSVGLFSFPPRHSSTTISSSLSQLPAVSTRVEAPKIQRHEDLFWKRIPVFVDVEEEEFLDYKWQIKNSIKNKDQAIAFLEQVLPDEQTIRDDVLGGIHQAPMSITLTPYVLSRIDWSNALHDPLRKQFLPLASTRELDHPMSHMDSLSEQPQSPVQGLVQRYDNKVALLSTTVCPLYCRFCFRSYFVGSETEMVVKLAFEKTNRERWKEALEYVRTHPAIEDMTITGGDTFFLSPDDIDYIGTTLLSIPHIRCFRFNTRGLTAAPMRVMSDHKWRNVICDLVQRGREKGKQVAIHLHFNHPNEISWITEQAALSFFKNGVTLRNQSVLLRGVNDSFETMSALIRKLSAINIQPYYVIQGEMVKGVEDLRTPLSTSLQLERQVQGLTTGFHLPKFIIMSPVGGKHLVHHYDTYDPIKGVSIFKSNFERNRGEEYVYCDPLHSLSPSMQEMWLNGASP